MSSLEFLRSSCHLLSALWNNSSLTQRRGTEKPGCLSENFVCLLLWINLWQDKLLKTFCLLPFWYAPVDQFSQNLSPYGCGPTNREENTANISRDFDAYPLTQMKITGLTLCFCNFITWETNIYLEVKAFLRRIYIIFPQHGKLSQGRRNKHIHSLSKPSLGDLWGIPEYQVTLKWGYIWNGLDQVWSSEWLKKK